MHLLSVNQQIKTEAKGIYYSRNKFYIRIDHHCIYPAIGRFAHSVLQCGLTHTVSLILESEDVNIRSWERTRTVIRLVCSSNWIAEVPLGVLQQPCRVIVAARIAA